MILKDNKKEFVPLYPKVAWTVDYYDRSLCITISIISFLGGLAIIIGLGKLLMPSGIMIPAMNSFVGIAKLCLFILGLSWVLVSTGCVIEKPAGCNKGYYVLDVVIFIIGGVLLYVTAPHQSSSVIIVCLAVLTYLHYFSHNNAHNSIPSQSSRLRLLEPDLERANQVILSQNTAMRNAKAALDKGDLVAASNYLNQSIDDYSIRT